MAFTYSPQDAIDHLELHVKDIPVFELDAVMCDAVSSIMYSEWMWRWTITAFTAIPLVDGQQDYTLPTTLYRLDHARIVRTDTSPDTYLPDLNVAETLSPNLNPCSAYSIRAITHDATTNKLRLERAMSVSTGETWELQGGHQPNHTKIDESTIKSAFWVPDHYFHVYIEGLKWKLYEYADDSRAGVVTIDRMGNRQAAGQAGKFYMGLDVMRQAEDRGSGNASEYPDEPFGVSSSYY